MDTKEKLANMISRKIFLKKCKEFGIIPMHIIQSFKCLYSLFGDLGPHKNRAEREIVAFQKFILCLEIDHTYYKIDSLTQHMNVLMNSIVDKTQTTTHKLFFEEQEIQFQKHLKLRNKGCDKKFKQLYSKKLKSQTSGTNLNINSDWVVNLTNVELPPEMIRLLSFGKKLSLHMNLRDTPFFQLISDTEKILNNIYDNEAKNAARMKVINCIQNYICRRQNREEISFQNVFFNKIHYKTLLFIKHQNTKENQILISTSDKGNKSVILFKNDYYSGMNELIGDPTVYKKIKSNPTMKTQAENKLLINRIIRDETMNQDEKLKLTKTKTSNATIAKLYGLVKTHKLDPNNIPGDTNTLKFRPIVSCINSPTYKLSRFISDVLQNCVTSRFHVLNSYDFQKFIVQQKIPEFYKLISLDIVSLFTNIPLILVREMIVHNWPRIVTHTSLTLDSFMEIVEFCTNRSFFMFNGEFYHQQDGLAMGQPYSPVIANLVVEILLEEVIEKLDFEIPFLKIYVDDIITAVPIDLVEYTVNIFNGYNPRLQFTSECEENSRLAFLDLELIHNEDNTISTEWYMKPTSSGRIINYNSNHPMTLKMNTAYGFINRVMSLTSNLNYNTRNTCVKMLRKNDYPLSLINRLMNRCKTKQTNPNTTNESRKQNALYRSLTYVPELSERISSLLRKQIENLAIGFKTKKSLGDIYSHLKDKEEKWFDSGVIYSIPCTGCGDSSYIGVTTQYLRARIGQHRDNVRSFYNHRFSGNASALETLVSRSALVEHVSQTEHDFDFDNTKIIDRAGDLFSLYFLEMLAIRTNKCVNKRSDIEKLSIAYSGILEDIVHIRK
jgi:hypothetical protein